jgi:hypothetical protein
MTEDLSSPDSDDAPTYVDTPYGMLTGAGQWYHVREEDVREYAGAVLDHVSLDQLLQWADAWVESPRTVTLWVLPALLWTMPAAWAALTSLSLYVVWATASPSLPTLVGARVGQWLEHVLPQALYYVLVLSMLAGAARYIAVGAGLLGFMLLRWGVVQWALNPLLRPLQRQLYPLPVADQVLRGLIVRVALRHRLSVPQLDAITTDILKNWGAHSDDDRSTRSASSD